MTSMLSAGSIRDHGNEWEGALMYGHVGKYDRPQTHDKNDYNNRWQ